MCFQNYSFYCIRFLHFIQKLNFMSLKYISIRDKNFKILVFFIFSRSILKKIIKIKSAYIVSYQVKL